jgi:hypothetical protein
MEYALKLHRHTIDTHVHTIYIIYFLTVKLFLYACVVLSSRSTYDYNLRQFTIDSLLAARQMFFTCP